MIPCHQKDEVLLDDIRSARPSTDRFDLWWLGQSGYLVHWNGHFLLLDPYLSDSLTEKYAGTDKEHIRMTELAIHPGKLSFVSVASSSHNHTDHLDAGTLVPLAESNPGLTLVLPAANEDFARQRLSGTGGSLPKFVGLDDGQTATVGPWEFHGIAAAHNDIARDEQGRCHYLGCVVRFGPFALYHSGDTLWHEGLVPALRPHLVDLALLPINGDRPERRVAGNLNGTEAAALAKAIHAGLVVPCHYHQFTFNTEEPDEFAAVCQRLGQPFRILRCGERLGLSHSDAGLQVEASPGSSSSSSAISEVRQSLA